MSQPKKKISRARRNTRRFNSHRKDKGFSLTTCPETGEQVRSHHYTLAAIDARNEAKKAAAAGK